MEKGKTTTCADLIATKVASASSLRNYWYSDSAGLFKGKFDKHKELNSDQVEYLRTRSGKLNGKKTRKTSGKTTESTPFFVRKDAQKVEGILEFAHKKDTPSKGVAENPADVVRKESAGDWIKSRRFLVFSMLVLFTAQAIHTAGFFWHNTPFEDSLYLRFALAVLCAIGMDTIALVMTAHGGSKLYLYVFAGFHFTINCLFHTQQYLIQAFIDLALFAFLVKFIGAVVLSSALSYGLFSYTELFTKAFDDEPRK